ncbi:hypothetical protein ACFLV4_08150 [Chloroflexota bacterium]
MERVRYLAIAVLLLGVVGAIMGGVFLAQGVTKNNQLREAMRVEHVTLGIEGTELKGEVIDSLSEAQKAGDTIREHRRGIAATYEDLLGGEKYDPIEPKQLTYAQALNLENYLYLAVVAFGLVTVTMAAGGFMIITGIGLGITGVALLGLARGTS